MVAGSRVTLRTILLSLAEGDPRRNKARVLGVHGFYDGNYLCGELNSLSSPYGSRLTILLRKLGDPDLVRHEDEQVPGFFSATNSR